MLTSSSLRRSDNIIQMELLEHHIRDDMNRRSARTMVVLKPVRVVITNLAEGHVEQLEALVRPDIKEDQGHGTYKVGDPILVAVCGLFWIIAGLFAGRCRHEVV